MHQLLPPFDTLHGPKVKIAQAQAGNVDNMQAIASVQCGSDVAARGCSSQDHVLTFRSLLICSDSKASTLPAGDSWSWGSLLAMLKPCMQHNC